MQTMHPLYRVYPITISIDIKNVGYNPTNIEVGPLNLIDFPPACYTEEEGTLNEFTFVIEPPSEALMAEGEKILNQMGDSLRYAAFESSYSPDTGVVEWVQKYLLRYLPRRVPFLAKSSSKLVVKTLGLNDHQHEPVFEIKAQTRPTYGGEEDEEIEVIGQVPMVIYLKEEYFVEQDA